MSRLFALLLTPAFLAGCGISPTPNYDMRFGDAVRHSRQAQTLNPTASTASVDGMDGMAAKAANDRYIGTFRAPPPPVNVINIGGSLAAGTGQ